MKQKRDYTYVSGLRHKITIRSTAAWPASPSGRLWYTRCRACDSVWATPAPIFPGGPAYYGRTTWDAALALGIAHQKEHS